MRHFSRLAPAIAAVLAAILTACSPGGAQAAAPAAAPVVDGPVDIGGGRQLYLHCAGPTTTGRPTIVLESGYHDSSDPWSLTDAQAPARGPSTFERLSQENRVCAYDRPGTFRYTDPLALTDRSTPVPMPRTAGQVVDDLHALLTAAAVPGPYLLVAHSLGGLFARLYTQRYPADVVGVVFVDAFPLEMPELMGGVWTEYAHVLDNPVPAFAGNPNAEVVDIDASVAQIRAAPAYPAVPSAVLSKTERFPSPRAPRRTSARRWSGSGSRARRRSSPSPRVPRTPWSPAATTTSRSTTRTWCPPPPNCC